MYKIKTFKQIKHFIPIYHRVKTKILFNIVLIYSDKDSSTSYLHLVRPIHTARKNTCTAKHP